MTNTVDVTSMIEQLQSYLDMGMAYNDFTDDEKSFMNMFMIKNIEKTETNNKNGQRRKQTKNIRIRQKGGNIPPLPGAE